MAFDDNYNPSEGLLNFISIQGEESVTFQFVQGLINEQITQGVVFGVRCGASMLTLVLMFMISKNRRTPVFIINAFSLSMVIVHSTLYITYILTGFTSLAYVLTGFPQAVSLSDFHVFAACNIIQALLIASIEASLVFQVRVIFAGDQSKRIGHSMTFLSIMIAFATVGMYFFTAIVPVIDLYTGSTNFKVKYFNISLILLASSINFTTILLTIKLAMAIRTRRFLGLKQFDTFHILLIVSFQTMLIPSLLFILAYSLPASKGTDYLIPIATMISVLSLPLSSMWATASNRDVKPHGTSQFSSSSGSYYGSSLNYCSESVYSKSRKSLKAIFYDFCSNHRADSDKQSEKTCYEDIDLEKEKYQELSTPIVDENQFTDRSHDNSYYKQTKEKFDTVDNKNPDCRKSFTHLRESCELNNFKNNDQDLKDDTCSGFIETKRITLKK